MEKVTSSLADRLLEFLAQPKYQPLKQHELAAALHVKGSDRARLRAALRALERQGKVNCIRKNRWALPDRTKLIQARLSVHHQGFGIATPDNSELPEIFVSRDSMETALHGDVVLVSITRPAAVSHERRGRGAVRSARAEGRIARILERKAATLVGLLRRSKNYWYAIPDNPRMLQDVRVRETAARDGALKEFHKVVVKLDPWERASDPLTGVIVEDLGSRDAHRVDVLSVMRDHGLDPEFSQELQRAARRHPSTPTPSDLKGRKDLRGELTMTIDPVDAKDHDDAISLAKSASGQWIVGVHIANVAHFVPPSSPLDEEAYLRGNSVYMVDGFVPMLPPYLTSEVCSLKPNLDRLTHTVELLLDQHGNVLKTETFPSVIHSRARLNYDQVQQLLDDKPDHGIAPEFHETIHHMDHLARVLRARRIKHGAIDLAMPEINCILDDQGKPIALRRRGANEAYHLIEEFMLLANVAVAERLSTGQRPAIYRIHEQPSEAQWENMQMDLQALGLAVRPRTRDDLNKICHQVRGTPQEYAANLSILRNLNRAMYSSARVEHFGLAFNKYTHFTSPIRRYPDLIAHRLLNALELNQPPSCSHEEVAAASAHCSDTERNAAEAEDESLTIKRIQFYAEQLRIGEIGPHQALIVALVAKGLIVELLETLQRGLVAFSSLTDDYYKTDPLRGRATGQRRKNTYALGQTVSVELARVDETRRLVDFRLIAVTDRREPERKSKRKSRRQRMR